MYNLVVSGMPDAFNSDPFILGAGRAVSSSEYTEASLAERYRGLDGDRLEELISAPALFAYERGVGLPARIGRITRVLKRDDQIRLEYEFFPKMPAISPDLLEAAVWELDIGNYELYRTHWAVKIPDLGEALVERRILNVQQARRLPTPKQPLATSVQPPTAVIAPTAFRIPADVQQADLVAVMMPLKPEFSPVWESIKRAGQLAKLRSLRASDIWQDSVLVQDVFTLLWTSSIVVVDFTERNANVMYETGIAHTLGRPVIPITQSDQDVPFDLHHHRYLKYELGVEGLGEMETTLANRLRTVARRMAT